MVFAKLGQMIFENQLEAILLIVLSILFGYVLGRIGFKFRRKKLK